jgi:hypothetical protein
MVHEYSELLVSFRLVMMEHFSISEPLERDSINSNEILEWLEPVFPLLTKYMLLRNWELGDKLLKEMIELAKSDKGYRDEFVIYLAVGSTFQIQDLTQPFRKMDHWEDLNSTGLKFSNAFASLDTVTAHFRGVLIETFCFAITQRDNLNI